ncbi:hypothetical protein J6590_052601 [Homalodisca vitripennis]|nr:hypothetical protein J6590_052601 [Homalodisca vitripennis]
MKEQHIAFLLGASVSGSGSRSCLSVCLSACYHNYPHSKWSLTEHRAGTTSEQSREIDQATDSLTGSQPTAVTVRLQMLQFLAGFAPIQSF